MGQCGQGVGLSRIPSVFGYVRPARGIACLIMQRRLGTSHEMKAALERGLALALAPGALWLGGHLVTNSFGSAPIECALSGAAVLTLFFLLSRPRLAATPETVNNLWKKQLGLGATFDNLHLPCIRRGCQLCAV